MAIPAVTEAKSIPKFMKVELSDIMVERYFGSCSITKLPPAVNSIVEKKKRSEQKNQETEKIGIYVNVKVISAAVKHVIVPIGFLPARLTNRPATTPPTDPKMLPVTMTIEPKLTPIAKCCLKKETA